MLATEKAGARPCVGGIGVRPHLRQHFRHVDVELMRRRELAIDVTGAARMAEVGEVIQVAVGKTAAQLHCGKHRAQALAITA